MNTSTLIINGNIVDRTKILQYIHADKKLHAIKLVRQQAQIGLKDAKELVEMLEVNPYYELNDDFLTTTKIDVQDYAVKNKNRQSRKGSHIIETNTSNKKNIILIFLFIMIGVLMYFYFSSQSMAN